VSEDYDLHEVLGQGAYAQVRRAIDKRTGETRAIKILYKRSLCPSEEGTPPLELRILKSLDHPNILRLFQVYEDRTRFYIVTEYCSGGELFSTLAKRKRFHECEAALVMHQVMSAVAYCHERRVIHRDLKPENILLEEDEGRMRIRVADFGSSTFFTTNNKLNGRFGTPYYIAPEVLSGSYDQKCDVWSCGIILYILLTGRAPYPAASTSEVLRQVVAGDVDLEAEEISPGARDLLKRMLSVSLKDRLTAAEALADPWLNSHTSPSPDAPILINTLKRLRAFSNTIRLKDAIHTFIATQMMSQEDMNRLAETFQAIDVNGDGKLSREELVYMYRETVGEVAAEEEVKKIMENADTDGNGYIDFTEFMKANLDRTKHLCLDNLKTAFQTFDQDGNGTISLDELKSTLQSDLESDFELRELIREVDLDGDGEISWKEFATALSTQC
jgi:calcium-dependent protein kinase